METRPVPVNCETAFCLGAVDNLRGKGGGGEGGSAYIPQFSTAEVGGASEFPRGGSVLGSRSKKGDPITALPTRLMLCRIKVTGPQKQFMSMARNSENGSVIVFCKQLLCWVRELMSTTLDF